MDNEDRAFYFTFCLGDEAHKNMFAKVIAKSWGEAREKMVERFGTYWAFQYDEDGWTINPETAIICGIDPNDKTIRTQAELFNLKEITIE